MWLLETLLIPHYVILIIGIGFAWQRWCFTIIFYLGTTVNNGWKENHMKYKL